MRTIWLKVPCSTRTGFPEQAEHLALTQREAEIVDRMDGALAAEANVEVSGLDQIRHASFGILWWKSVARWNAAPILINLASSNERPMTCMPTGSPVLVKPVGIDNAGNPR